MFKKLKRAYKWYVKGYYHCDKCPWCWEDWSIEGDCDCGCYIKGDIQDTCRLLPPFRFLIGWFRKKRITYFEAHEYDGYGEWYEKEADKQTAYAESINIFLGDIELCRRDHDGTLLPVCKSEELEIPNYGSSNIYEAYRFYESKAHPIIPDPPLKKQWKKLLRKTWDKFADIFRPYFS